MIMSQWFVSLGNSRSLMSSASRPLVMHALRLLLVLFLGVFASFLARAFAVECSDETLRRCRENVMDVLSSNGRSEKNEVEDQCKSIRENFDCILWQTSTCLDKAEQDSNGDAILKAWRYMSSFCESQGSWWTKSCYQRDDVKRCEALLPSRGSSIDTSSCRSYASFRDCVISVVEVICSGTDQRLLGTYLMEKGQQRAWRCPKNSDPLSRPASAPLAADTRYNTMYSDSSQRSCVAESRASLQECLTDYDTKQQSSQKVRDSDMRTHKSCCAIVHYEDCVEKILQDRCGETEGRREARTIVSSVNSRLYNSCSDHTMNECSAASTLGALSLFYVLLTLATSLLCINF